jgi:RNA polymerase sigma factor (sigma-70 family)
VTSHTQKPLERPEERPENLAYKEFTLAQETTDAQWPEPQTSELYGALVRGATAITASLLGHKEPELAREIAARTLLALHSFRGGSGFSTWFYRIARNCTSTWLKAKLKRHETELEEAENIPAPKTALAEEDVLRLSRRYDELTSNQRTIVRLYLTGYRKNKEIALASGIPVRRVRYEWTLLKKHLKKP